MIWEECTIDSNFRKRQLEMSEIKPRPSGYSQKLKQAPTQLKKHISRKMLSREFESLSSEFRESTSRRVTVFSSKKPVLKSKKFRKFMTWPLKADFLRTIQSKNSEESIHLF